MQKLYNHLKRIICFALTISTVVCSSYFRPVKVYAADPVTSDVTLQLLEMIFSSLGITGFAINQATKEPVLDYWENLDAQFQNGTLSEEFYLSQISEKAFNENHSLNPYLKGLNKISYSRTGIAAEYGLYNILQNVSTYYEQKGNTGFKEDLHNAISFLGGAEDPSDSVTRLSAIYAVTLMGLLNGDRAIKSLLLDDDNEAVAGAVAEDTEFNAYNFDATGEEPVVDYLGSPATYTVKLLNEAFTGKNGWTVEFKDNYGIYIGQDYNIGTILKNSSGHYYVIRSSYGLRNYNSDKWEMTVADGIPVLQYPTDVDEAYLTRDPNAIINRDKPGYLAFLDDVLPRSIDLDAAIRDLLFNNLKKSALLPQLQTLSETVPEIVGRSTAIPTLQDLLRPALVGSDPNILEEILSATKALLFPMVTTQTAIRTLADGFPAITQDLDDILDIFPAITASLEDIIDIIPASTDIIATIINPIPGQLEDLGSAIIDLPGQISLPIVGVLEGIAADLADVKAKVLEGDLPSPPGSEDEDPEREGNGINPTGGLNAPFLALLATLIFLLMLLLKLLILFFNLFMYIVMIFNIPPDPSFLNDDMVSAIDYLRTLQIGNMGISVWNFLFGLIYIVMFFALIKLLRRFVERIELPS